MHSLKFPARASDWLNLRNAYRILKLHQNNVPLVFSPPNGNLFQWKSTQSRLHSALCLCVTLKLNSNRLGIKLIFHDKGHCTPYSTIRKASWSSNHTYILVHCSSSPTHYIPFKSADQLVVSGVPKKLGQIHPIALQKFTKQEFLSTNDVMLCKGTAPRMMVQNSLLCYMSVSSPE